MVGLVVKAYLDTLEFKTYALRPKVCEHLLVMPYLWFFSELLAQSLKLTSVQDVSAR